MQTIQDYIDRNYLQTEFCIKETNTNNGYSTKKYSLYYKGKLIESFTDEYKNSVAINEAYQYFLGYIDSYINFKKED